MVKVLEKINIAEGKRDLSFKTEDVFDFNDVYGENVDPRNFFIDENARTINRGRNKANDCIRRYIMSYDTFMETFKDSIFDMFGATKYVKPAGSADANYYQFFQQPVGIRGDQVEVLFYWARRPDKLVLMANDVVIYNGPNPYNHKQLPFAAASDVTRLRGFWARGESQLLESIQDELTTTRRMRLDRNYMDIFKMFLVSESENLDDDEAIVAPSRFLTVRDPVNGIRALEYGPVSPNAYQEEDRLKQDGREVTGVTSPMSSGTATEAAIFKEATMKVLQYKVWRWSRELLWDIYALRVPNIVQFYSEPNIEQIVGAQKAAEFRRIMTQNIQLKSKPTGELIEERRKGFYFFDVSPSDVVPTYGKYNLRIVGEASFPLSKPLRQQQVEKFFASPVAQAAMQSGYWDIKKAADIYAKEYDYDPDDLKQSTEEEPDVQGASEGKLIEIAGKKNEMMLAGQALPPTPYSTRAHTDLHLALMESERFKQALASNPQLSEIFSNHVLGEEKAQGMREQGSEEDALMSSYGGGSSTSEGILAGEAKATQPSMVKGAEFTPMGMMNK
jgi:hypothetical protein